MHPVRISDSMVIEKGSGMTVIAGPCVIESEAALISDAEHLKEICDEAGVGLIFKASYDKANRTSLSSYRGPGIEEGLRMLAAVKDKTGLPVLSDCHDSAQVKMASGILDVIQIPAFLCRQTDLIIAAADTGKAVNVKKGQFLAPWDMKNIVEKIESTGNRNILVTERGVTFGYNNLVNDMRSLVIMSELGYPVVFDATHSVQSPGGRGDSSGGDSKYAPYLAAAALCCKADVLFFEVHRKPETALSDGPNMIPMDDFGRLLRSLKALKGFISERLWK